MKNVTAIAGIVLCMLPLAATAAPKSAMHKMPVKKTVTAAMYECQTCHMKYSAADAKKDHYKDPMDGGALKPVKAAPKKNTTMSKPMGSSMGGDMGGMKM